MARGQIIQLTFAVLLVCLLFLTFEVYITFRMTPSTLANRLQGCNHNDLTSMDQANLPARFVYIQSMMDRQHELDLNSDISGMSNDKTDLEGAPMSPQLREFYDVGVNYDHLPADFEFINNPQSMCVSNEFGGIDSVSFLVGVESVPKNRAIRSAIRKTWANKALLDKISARLVFLVGLPETQETQDSLDLESLKHDDLVQGGFVDEYENLTMKTIMFLRWSYHYCQSADYVIKTDEDVFVNLMEISSLLTNLPRTRIYLGNVVMKSQVFRNPNYQWYTSFEAYPDQFYPVYNSGAFYILSKDVARDCYNHVWHHRTWYISSEDAFIGIIMNTLKVVPYPFQGIYIDISPVKHICVYVEYPVVHQTTAELLFHYWPIIDKMVSSEAKTARFKSKCVTQRIESTMTLY
ncbi:beta-1,3-galactosyltransferase 1-like [Saccoglossus kowalevskii]|uniref:Hexosyltransferase n=1 Tax=Saccoglossus kowalevskii TaxID=10224 RepID=A0ABM0MK74_SACKO|nr:PREDICTED: beta-1,3-galactosyltransferase 1-like [Saccoglossus kowalevskii]